MTARAVRPRSARQPQTRRTPATGRRGPVRRPARQPLGKSHATIRRSYASAKKLVNKIQDVKVFRDGPVSKTFIRYSPPGSYKQYLPKSLKMVAGSQNFLTNQSTRLSVASSQQDFVVIGNYFTAADLNQSTGLMAQLANFQTGTGTYKNFKVHLGEMTATNLLTNQTNDVVNVTLYDCVARQNIANSSYSDPGAAWYIGDLDVANAGARAFIGSTPFQSKAFTQYFEVKGVTNIQLHSGGHHRHMVKINPNRMFQNEQNLNLTATTSCFGRLSCFTLMVIHGYPCNETVTKTNIGTAPVAVDAICNKNYYYRMYGYNPSQIEYVNTLVTPAQLNIINDLTAAATTAVTV